MIVKELCSSDTNVKKFVFDFHNAVAEAVLYKYGTYQARTVVCCSTQSGCPMGCRFCGAGDNFVRNLCVTEIVEQVTYAIKTTGVDPATIEKGQIMFMSMGEPMLNFLNLEVAIRELHYLYPHFALLISTSAPQVDFNPLIELSKDIDKVGLQFSIHESTDVARDKLIPFKNKLNLNEISAVGTEWYRATGRMPFINYCAHSNNTSTEDADRLWRVFTPAIWQATVSVICEREESVAAANIRQRELAQNFMGELLNRGFSVRCFDPAGQDDIGGGCGQLWFVQEWMRRNPALARGSIGEKMPLVHTPRDENA